MGFLSDIGGKIFGGSGSFLGGWLGKTLGFAIPGIGTIGSILGSVGGSLLSNKLAGDNAETAFRRSMDASNTSYQRAVVDMMAAGLNPGLAYSQGGASVPNAASPVPPDIGSSFGTGISTALAAARTGADIEYTKALASKARAEARTANVEAQMQEMLGPTIRAVGGGARIAGDLGSSALSAARGGFGLTSLFKRWFKKE